LLADIVDGAAAEKQPERQTATVNEQTASASSPGPANRDREHTTIQSRAVTVGSRVFQRQPDGSYRSFAHRSLRPNDSIHR
jgi:hypothetical protein